MRPLNWLPRLFTINISRAININSCVFDYHKMAIKLFYNLFYNCFYNDNIMKVCEN